MELRKSIESRYSARKFLDKEVPMEKVMNMLEHARLAPSSGNTQCWKFIIVTDKKKKADIAKACLDQLWIASAPVLIIVCNQYSKVVSLYGNLGKMFSIQDCAIISSYLQLLAVDEGLGSCWIGAFDSDTIRGLLKIPDDTDPEIILALGYAGDEPKLRNRREIEQMIFFESWGTKSNPFAKKKKILEIAKEYIKG